MVESHLKFFTLVERETIENIVKEHKAEPEKRLAQNVLANEVVTLLHGPEVLSSVTTVKDLMYPSKKEQPLDSESDTSLETQKQELKQYIKALSNYPDVYKKMLLPEVLTTEIAYIMVKTGLAKNKTQAMKAMSSGGVTYGRIPKKVTKNELVTLDMLELETLLIIRIGSNVKAIHCFPTFDSDKSTKVSETSSEEDDASELDDDAGVTWAPSTHRANRR